MLQKVSLTVIVLFTITATGIVAQNARENRRRSFQGRQGMDRLEQAGLKLGMPMPDLTAYDADGNPLNLRELMTGHYSILVFGCLT